MAKQTGVAEATDYARVKLNATGRADPPIVHLDSLIGGDVIYVQVDLVGEGSRRDSELDPAILAGETATGQADSDACTTPRSCRFSNRRVAAIDDHDRARHVGGLVAGQKQDGAGDLRRVGETLQQVGVLVRCQLLGRDLT